MLIVAGVFDDIKMMLRRGDALTWLIAINCVAFVVVCAVSAVANFASADVDWLYSWFFLNSSGWHLLTHPLQVQGTRWIRPLPLLLISAQQE